MRDSLFCLFTFSSTIRTKLNNKKKKRIAEKKKKSDEIDLRKTGKENCEWKIGEGERRGISEPSFVEGVKFVQVTPRTKKGAVNKTHPGKSN